MNNPLVSIIIPSYNRAHLIHETLDSVLVQTYSNWECIVVDDGSTDTTEEVLESYVKKDARFQYHKRPTNRKKGANACRNYGKGICNGDYLIFVDSDDVLSLSCLEFRVKNIITYPNYNCWVYSTSTLYPPKNRGDNIVNKDPEIESEKQYLNYFLSYNFAWHTMSPIWDSKFIKGYSFNENLSRLQDVDFHIRVLLDNKIKLKRIFRIDNFYKVTPYSKRVNSKFRLKVINSFFIFAENLIPKISQKSIFSRFYINIFRNFIIHEISTFNVKNFKLLIKLYKSGLISLKQLINILCIQLLYISGFINLKGLGVYRFKKKLFNILETTLK